MLQITGKQPRDRIFDLRRWDTPQKRLANGRVAAQATAQNNVESLQRLAIRTASGGPLQADIARPMLRARMRARVEVELEVRDFVAEQGGQPLHKRGELL